MVTHATSGITAQHAQAKAQLQCLEGTEKLSKRIAVITGGTRGIGLATARELTRAGLSVLVTGTRNSGYIPDTCQFRQVDFSRRDQLKLFAEELRELSPDVLINNVGIECNKPFDKLTLDEFETVLQVNLLASFMLSQASLVGMVAKKWGRIVNVTSVWGKISRSYRAAYSASKFAIEGLSLSLADEFAERGVLINCVAPGFVDIDATGQPGRGPARNAQLAAHVPLRRLGTPEEVARVIAWIASEQNTYMTGQSLSVDGGFSRTGNRINT
jgi:NAD(P)-dependent dehydrogenase (short-subunit alcohol dehydrogenase family)